MDDKKLFLTPEGAGKLRDELKELTGPRRKAMAERLHHAVRQGDLAMPEAESRYRTVCDYVAGMTDRFALQEHAKLFDPGIQP